VADDVGVYVFAEVKANGDSAGTGGVGIVIGHRGNAGEVGEANGHGRSLLVRMSGAGERSDLWRGRKLAQYENALGVGGAKTGVQAEEVVERLD
jgi:hypothetical protein